MPRKHRYKRPPALPPAPVAVADVWGYTPEPEAEVATLPPLPPEPARATGDEASEPPESLVALGPPPSSERASQRWAHRLLMLQAYEVAKDPTISNLTRVKRVCAILASAARMFPDAARAELADIIDEDRRQLEDRRRAKARAKMEARPPPGEAKVIPLRRDG